ncbi:MAG: DNA-formamidopyrimidine glycosylase family protein, partial [Burkholderiales bacterium]
MPELPEVETIVRQIAPRLEGFRISRAQLNKTDVLR